MTSKKDFTFIWLLVLKAPQAFYLNIGRSLQKIIMKIGYGINFKYEGWLSYSLDRFISFKIPIARRYMHDI